MLIWLTSTSAQTGSSGDRIATSTRCCRARELTRSMALGNILPEVGDAAPGRRQTSEVEETLDGLL